MKRTTNGPTHSTPAIGRRIAFGGAVLALLGSLASCGGQHSRLASDQPTGSAVNASSPIGGPVTAMPAMVTPQSSNSPGSRVISLGDSLPPEVAVSVQDSLVRAGQVVELVAVEGSDDVSQMGLSDGLGRMQLFTRDPASNLWHVLYRVPLNTKKEKLALSVTAMNDVKRWRRVWVFVPVSRSTPGSEIHDDDDVDAEDHGPDGK